MKDIKLTYTRAVNSSDLRDDELHHATDHLAAVALSSDLGALLIRARYSGNSHSIFPALKMWREMLAKKGKQRGWLDVADEIAVESFGYYLNSICNTCQGRGAAVIPDTPMLADAPCPDCLGTKKRIMQFHPRISQMVIESIDILNRLENGAARAAREKLGT